MAFEPLQILAGGLLGFASAGAIRWWQYRRDLLISRVEKFCDAVEQASEMANEHWLLASPAENGEWIALSEEARKCLMGENLLIGKQTLVDGLFASIVPRLRERRRGHA